MSNREKFKDTFEQVTMSEECFSEIKGMKDIRKTSKMLKYAGAIAAAFAIVILTGNGVCYAMTGNSIVEEVQEIYKKLTKEEVMVNGEEHSDAVVDSYDGEDGLTYFELADGSKAGIVVKDPDHETVFLFYRKDEEGTTSVIVKFKGEVHERDGRIYLDIVDEMDITEDFADGVATGTFKHSLSGCYDNENFEYCIEGTLENYTVKIKWIEQ